jgi:hypothetical protein
MLSTVSASEDNARLFASPGAPEATAEPTVPALVRASPSETFKTWVSGGSAIGSTSSSPLQVC